MGSTPPKSLIYDSYQKLTKLEGAEKFEATKQLFSNYGVREVLTELAYTSFYKSYELAEHLNIKELFPFEKRPIRTVAMYFPQLYAGGAERVMALLTHILKNAGYKVILFTDEEPNEKDFNVAVGTPRVVLGKFVSDIKDNGGYLSRYDIITESIKKYQIDAVINHAWFDRPVFFDMCTVKSTGAAYIIHSHNVFLDGLNGGYDYILKSGPIFLHADAMITLNEVDRMYWSTYNSSIFCVNNPLTFDPRSLPSAPLESHNIIWTGRFDPLQKNPHDALSILSKVLKFVPDAKLYMLGNGDSDVVEELYQLAKDLKIDDHVEFPGFVNDVETYLLKSSVFLVTSNYEGFSMVFAEALSCGVPCVTYPLPYIAMVNNSQSTISVPWKDRDKAALAIVEILQNDEKRFVMGKQAKAEAIALKNIDYEKMWTDIFDAISSDKIPEKYVPDVETQDIFYQTVNIGLMQTYYYIKHNGNQRHLLKEIEALKQDKQITVEWFERNKQETINWLNSQHDVEIAQLNADLQNAKSQLQAIYNSKWYRLKTKLEPILKLFRKST